MPLTQRDRLMEWLPFALGALVFAGLVHIVTVFAVPYLSTSDAWTTLASRMQTNRFIVLDRGAAGEAPLPYEDPRTFIGACVYDLSAGPVRVQADFSGDGLVIMSFHDRRGATFYALNDRGGLRGKLDALLANDAQIEAIEAETPEDAPVQELRLRSPTRTGFIIARSVILDSSDVQDAQRRLSSLSCAQQQAPG